MRKEAQCLVTGLNGAQTSSVAVGREDLEDLGRTPTPFKKKEELLKGRDSHHFRTGNDFRRLTKLALN